MSESHQNQNRNQEQIVRFDSEKFMFVSRLRKDMGIKLLEKLSINELIDLINLQDKESLIKLISSSYNRGQINEMIYRSRISEDDILTVKSMKQIKV
jgi:NAD-dependent DNA ligase